MIAIGIDGGGSKTEFCLYDGRVIKSILIEEPSNYHLVGIEKTKEIISRGINEVSRGCSFDVVGAGLSGVDREADKRQIEKVFEEIGIKHFFIQNDGITALWGATGGVGILLIAGTGSIVVSRNRNGEIHRVGGWGYAFDEYCGGYWFVTQTVKALLDYKDMGIQIAFTDELINFFGFEKVEDLIYLYYSGNFDKSKISSAARIVLNAAARGEELPLRVLKEGLENAMKMIRIVQKRGKFDDNFVFSYTGGIFKSEYFFKRFKRVFESYFPKANIVEPRNSPAVGAAMMAIHEMGKVK